MQLEIDSKNIVHREIALIIAIELELCCSRPTAIAIYLKRWKDLTLEEDDNERTI